jgi:hypothetical protein
MDIAEDVYSALKDHPAVESVRLVGSRANGAATKLSDWDFEVETSDFELLANDLPVIAERLGSLGHQWDPLSAHANYMLMLPGANKVDVIFFDRPFRQRPPWRVSAETLAPIDHHFWDWTLWLASKETAGKRELAAEELSKMSAHLLEPLGVEETPASVHEAVATYTTARNKAERRYGVTLSRQIESEVRRALREAGYEV